MLSTHITQLLPEGNLKHRLEDLEHIEDLPIAEAGISSGEVPFVRLKDGLIFYGHYPNKRQKYIYRLMSRSFRKQVPEAAYNVTWDIWLRYYKGHINQQRYYQLKPGDTVVEAGAYVGYYTLKMSQAVGPTGRVVAIEPITENREIILKNIEANDIQNVTVLPYAIWNKSGTKTFYVTDRQKNSIFSDLLKGKGIIKETTIATNSIDNVVSETGLPNLNFVIITVNGAEIEALEGMTKTLENDNLHIVIAAKYVVDGIPVYKRVATFLEEKGYELKLDHYGFTKNEDPNQHAVIYASRTWGGS